MKRIFTAISILSFLVAACTPKTNPDVENPDGPDIITPEPPQPPGPGPVIDIVLQGAFSESFSAKRSEIFDFSYREDGADDLRFYPAFPSWNEKGTDLLMLRVDPSDPSGLNKAPRIIAKQKTFYGSYSVRMRLPDIKAVQANIGINAVFTTAFQDEKLGYSNIEMMWKMADPNLVYLSTISDLERFTEELRDPVSGFKPCAAYYTYGFDWHADKLVWWIKVGNEPQTIKEITQTVPTFPSILQFAVYHSKNNPLENNPNAIQAPYYPYEFEIDAICYEPFQEEIDDWIESQNQPKE